MMDFSPPTSHEAMMAALAKKVRICNEKIALIEEARVLNLEQIVMEKVSAIEAYNALNVNHSYIAKVAKLEEEIYNLKMDRFVKLQAYEIAIDVNKNRIGLDILEITNKIETLKKQIGDELEK